MFTTPFLIEQLQQHDNLSTHAASNEIEAREEAIELSIINGLASDNWEALLAVPFIDHPAFTNIMPAENALAPVLACDSAVPVCLSPTTPADVVVNAPEVEHIKPNRYNIDGTIEPEPAATLFLQSDSPTEPTQETQSFEAVVANCAENFTPLPESITQLIIPQSMALPNIPASAQFTSLPVGCYTFFYAINNKPVELLETVYMAIAISGVRNYYTYSEQHYDLLITAPTILRKFFWTESHSTLTKHDIEQFVWNYAEKSYFHKSDKIYSNTTHIQTRFTDQEIENKYMALYRIKFDYMILIKGKDYRENDKSRQVMTIQRKNKQLFESAQGAGPYYFSLPTPLFGAKKRIQLQAAGETAVNKRQKI